MEPTFHCEVTSRLEATIANPLPTGASHCIQGQNRSLSLETYQLKVFPFHNINVIFINSKINLRILPHFSGEKKMFKQLRPFGTGPHTWDDSEKGREGKALLSNWSACRCCLGAPTLPTQHGDWKCVWHLDNHHTQPQPGKQAGEHPPSGHRRVGARQGGMSLTVCHRAAYSLSCPMKKCQLRRLEGSNSHLCVFSTGEARWSGKR